MLDGDRTVGAAGHWACVGGRRRAAGLAGWTAGGASQIATRVEKKMKEKCRKKSVGKVIVCTDFNNEGDIDEEDNMYKDKTKSWWCW
uniref:Uncharacterized protein n=1 Tax=Trichogramma kaykai TaxID=54128 RepID=A0ABD2WD61_9HYME